EHTSRLDRRTACVALLSPFPCRQRWTAAGLHGSLLWLWHPSFRSDRQTDGTTAGQHPRLRCRCCGYPVDPPRVEPDLSHVFISNGRIGLRRVSVEETSAGVYSLGAERGSLVGPDA